NPEIKWRLVPDDISRLAELQSRLLQNAARAVRDGGRLVYSTCSLESEEGEGVIHRFLQGRSDFRLIRPDVDPSLVTDEGFVRPSPQSEGGAVFWGGGRGGAGWAGRAKGGAARRGRRYGAGI